MCPLSFNAFGRWGCVAVILLLTGSALAGTTNPQDGHIRVPRRTEPNTHGAESASNESNGTSESPFHWLSRSAIGLIRDCADSGTGKSAATNGGRIGDIGVCLKLAAVRAIDKLSRTKRELPLAGGLVLVPNNSGDGKVPVPGKTSSKVTPVPSLDELPRSVQERHQWADRMLISRLVGLLESHSLRLQLPSAKSLTEIVNQGDEDSVENPAGTTRRRQGVGSLLNLSMLMGSSFLPVKLSLLAILVGKAFLLSVLAFFIPVARFLQAVVMA